MLKLKSPKGRRSIYEYYRRATKKLGELFPDVLTEGRIDFDQLKRVLGEWIEPDRERFGLICQGKPLA